MPNKYSVKVKRAALLAICTALFLVIIKAIAWWKTGSVSILATITDSLLDFIASLTGMLILRYSLMPADDNHSFGHGKAESLALLAQGMFIIGSVVFLFLQGIHSLNTNNQIQNNCWGIGVTILSVLLTAGLVAYQKYIIKQTDSQAIKADCLHYQTDLLMNIAILLALLLNSYGFLQADAICALILATLYLWQAVKMVYEAVQSLLDVALPNQEIEQIKTIALQNPNIIGIHDLKTRRSGAVRFIQLHLELDDHLSLWQAHEITEQIEQALSLAFPHSDIMIHQEPISIVLQEAQQLGKTV